MNFEGKKTKMARATRVKNKAPAPVQITAEQILREAAERQEPELKIKQRISDPEELAEYKYRKRKEFEDKIRRNKTQISTYIRYSAWEETQGEFERARSVYERALDIDYRNVNVWLKYAEMEMRHKNINAARNVWDRAITLLPRVDQFWLKYSYMEDILGNYPAVRQIFERWMQWEPEKHAWNAYIKFELRCNEVDRARKIFERFVQVHPKTGSWLKWARFEEKYGTRETTRHVFETAVTLLSEFGHDEKLYISFAKFEERCKEFERARAIYKYALDNIPKKEAQELYKTWIAFEKKYGDREGIEDVIIAKRRFQYEEELKLNPKNYDTWFDYIKLEEDYGDDINKVREVYERAIAQLPPATEKRFWKRYIYLWIYYALFEELQAKDIERTRAVYKEALKQIPHKVFSFSKMWLLYANFEIRQKNLQAVRSIFGHAIGVAPKQKLFEAYVQFEMQLGNISRCRVIYEKWLEFNPANCVAWVKYATLETDLGEIERSRALYEFAVAQPQLDMPEFLWKSYIDFEINQEEYDKARNLFKRLLQRSKHVKVWISYAQFEGSISELDHARAIYKEGIEELKNSASKEERNMLIENWVEFEMKYGDENSVKQAQQYLPKKVIKKRPLKSPEGEELGLEEYEDYIFPGEESAANLKILERAKLWKKQKTEESSTSS